MCLSSLGYFDSAVEDLLAALQCKVEPRHNIIDISLNNLQVECFCDIFIYKYNHYTLYKFHIHIHTCEIFICI